MLRKFGRERSRTMGMGVDPTVIGLFILGVLGVEIIRRLRRKAS
jgi:hypothetical protein